MHRVRTISDETIAHAAAVIRDGGLLGLPTETVYGLAANALDGNAIARIFEAKGRPSFNPLIVHIASIADAEKFAVFNDDAYSVAEHFWPGPLTIILPRKDDCSVSDLATAGLPTIALRIPSHETARKIIKAAGVPVAAPSANPSGTLSATTAEHVARHLGDKLDLILAGGASEIGLESTVLDLSGDAPVVLRPGAITAEDLKRVLGKEVLYGTGDTHAPKSPGLLLKHYAPNIPVRLNAPSANDGEAYLAFGPDLKNKAHTEHNYRNLSDKSDLYEAAANLFSYLHILDNDQNNGIAVAPIPNEGLGIAINDRLKRAAEQ